MLFLIGATSINTNPNLLRLLCSLSGSVPPDLHFYRRLSWKHDILITDALGSDTIKTFKKVPSRLKMLDINFA